MPQHAHSRERTCRSRHRPQLLTRWRPPATSPLRSSKRQRSCRASALSLSPSRRCQRSLPHSPPQAKAALSQAVDTRSCLRRSSHESWAVRLLIEAQLKRAQSNKAQYFGAAKRDFAAVCSAGWPVVLQLDVTQVCGRFDTARIGVLHETGMRWMTLSTIQAERHVAQCSAAIISTHSCFESRMGCNAN